MSADATMPAISLPNGGGGITGLGETFQPNLFTGTGNFSIPIALTAGRAGFGPQLSLQYSSGYGNGPFGLGWQLSVPRITRQTEKGIPTYEETDQYLLSGGETLVPRLIDSGGTLVPEVIDRAGFSVTRFMPRTAGAFARIERWARNGDVHWRTTTRDNLVCIYGRTPVARVVDPGDTTGTRVFEWLVEETFDAHGNHMLYEYARDERALDIPGVAHQNRQYAQRYLRRVYYGNAPGGTAGPQRSGTDHRDQISPMSRRYLLEVLFDYGDLPMRVAGDLVEDPYVPAPAAQEAFGTPASAAPVIAAPVRPDPFSTHRSGFEIRTCRRCRRVLMVHHFTELGGPTLVRSTDFEYALNPHAGFSMLRSVTARGYRRSGAGFRAAALPPIALGYSAFDLEQCRYRTLTGEQPPPGSLKNAEYALADIFGDGAPDVVQAGRQGVRYWRNRGDGRLDWPRQMPVQPAGGVLGDPEVRLADLGGDGVPDLLVHTGALKGFYELDTTGAWQAFRRYQSAPDVSLADPNLRMVDLTGDGLADLLVTTDAHFLWYQSLGKDGFAEPRPVERIRDLDAFPDVFFSDLDGRVRLADMTGDGVDDIVLAHDGGIDYWPNLGYGRFGRRITMSNAPRFESPFDPARLLMVDVDGTGCADLVYVGSGRVQVWFNQSGNGWSDPVTIEGTPAITDRDAVHAADIYGSGTASLLWSFDIAVHPEGNYKVLDLCGGVKPHLLIEMSNSMGATTRVGYAPSTKFSREDAAAGRPWATTLPFPVQVVDKIEAIDHVGRSKLVTTFKYHHGSFDGRDREFRGFGMVERFDSEQFEPFATTSLHGELPEIANGVKAFHAPPIRTATWFHTGAYWDEGDTLTERYRTEYFADDAEARPLGAHTIEAGPTPHEAHRALRGAVLRAEVFGDDGSAAAGVPYLVTEHRYDVRLLQPALEAAPHSVYLVLPCETVEWHYDRNPADPRVRHQLTLQSDGFGNVIQAATIAYPRRLPTPDAEQQKLEVLLQWSKYINDTAAVDRYFVGVLCESRAYELSALQPPAARGALLNAAAFAALLDPDRFDPPEAAMPAGSKRLLTWSRKYFKRDQAAASLDAPDAAGGRLPFGQIGRLGLPYESYRAAFSPGLLPLAYGGRATTAMLRAGGYVRGDDLGLEPAWQAYWWMPSGRQAFLEASFYRPLRTQDPFGTQTSVDLDVYALLPVAAHDPFGGSSTAAHDYRVLQPAATTDTNGSRSRFAFDTLGCLVATAVASGDDAQGDTLDGLAADLDPALVRRFVEDPVGAADPALDSRDLIKSATTRIVYDFWSYHDRGLPAASLLIGRDRHAREPGGPQSRLHHTVQYCDGFGRQVHAKTQAEPDPQDPQRRARWIGKGLTIFNNKGKPVRQFEPFFAAAPGFERREAGVSPVLFYDPLERAICTLHPNHTFQKVVYGPWEEVTWDLNDTVLLHPGQDPDVSRYVSEYLATEEPGYVTWFDAAIPDPGNVPLPAARTAEQDAALKARQHAGTPNVVRMNTSGRAFLTVSNDGAATFDTRVVLDILGLQREVIAPGGLSLFAHLFDMSGRKMTASGADAGTRATLLDVAGHPTHEWDANGTRVRTESDKLRRLTEIWVTPPGESEHLAAKVIHGDEMPDRTLDVNHRGKVWATYDGAGLIIHDAYDFKGNLLKTRRRLLKDPGAQVRWNRPGDASFDMAYAETLLDPPADAYTVETSFDAANRTTGERTRDRTERRWTYNDGGLFASLNAAVRGAANAIPIVSASTYDAHGRRVEVDYANGLTTMHVYDASTSRLVRSWTRDAGGGDLQDVRLTYDAAGNITRLEDAAQAAIVFRNQTMPRVSGFTYNALYRLVAAEGREHAGGGAIAQPADAGLPVQRVDHPADATALRRYRESYAYDAAGNLTSVTHTPLAAAPPADWTLRYDIGTASNRMQATSLPGDADTEYSAPYEHDANGNIVRMPHTGRLTWNFKDQLVGVDLGGGDHAHYQYDLGGARVRKVVLGRNGQIAKECLYLQGLEIVRRFRGGALREEWELVHLTDASRRAATAETATVKAGKRLRTPVTRFRFQITDHLGSGRFELDGAANVITYEEYSPYGRSTYRAQSRGTRFSAKRYRFCGKELDEETGFYYYGARYYAAWLARWISPDPLGVAAGVNPYEYSRGNPILLTDPSGLAPTPDPDMIPPDGAIVADLKTGWQDLQSLVKQSPNKEFALVEREGQLRVLAGGSGSVSLGPKDSLIAHTHPSGIPLLPDAADITEMMKRGNSTSLMTNAKGDITFVMINTKTGAGEAMAVAENGEILAHFELLDRAQWGKAEDPGWSNIGERFKVPKGSRLLGLADTPVKVPGGGAAAAGSEAAGTAAKGETASKLLGAYQKFKNVQWTEVGLKGLKILGSLVSLYGAHNVAMKNYKETPGSTDTKQGAYAITFFLATFAGAFDDALMVTPGAPMVFDSWEANGAGPCQVATGNVLRAADRQYDQLMTRAADAYYEKFMAPPSAQPQP